MSWGHADIWYENIHKTWDSGRCWRLHRKADLRGPIFAFSENCLGCTEVSRLPFPESLCMTCTHGKSWNDSWKLAIYALTWFLLLQMGNSGQSYWIIDNPFKRLWYVFPFPNPIMQKVISFLKNLIFTYTYLYLLYWYLDIKNQTHPQHFNYMILFEYGMSLIYFPSFFLFWLNVLWGGFEVTKLLFTFSVIHLVFPSP